MSKNQNELDEYLSGKLRLLAKVSSLNPQAVTEEREKFLARGAMLRAAAVEHPQQPKVGGLQAWLLALGDKQRSLSNVMVALVLVLALVFGSTGATVYAAQQSLPSEFLYPVKILSEDVRLLLTVSTENQLGLMLDYSNRRVDEISELRRMGMPVPEEAVLRTQEQLDSALQIAAEMNDQQLLQALGQIRYRAEVQTERMAALMSGVSEDVDPSLAQLQVRLQEQVQVAAEGEVDPEGFRQLVRSWTRERYRPNPSFDALDTTPESPNGNSEPGNKPAVTPGQYGPGTPSETRPPTEKDPGNGSGMNEVAPTDVVAADLFGSVQTQH